MVGVVCEDKESEKYGGDAYAEHYTMSKYYLVKMDDFDYPSSSNDGNNEIKDSLVIKINYFLNQ